MSIRLNADFYRVELPNGAPRFEELVAIAQQLPIDDVARALTIDNKAVRLQHGGNRGAQLECEMICIDFDDIPKKAKRNGQVSHLNLAPDEGVGSETAFVFDPVRDILVLQRNRNGVTAKKLARYFEEIGGLNEPLVLSPVITPGGLNRLRRMRTYRKAVIKIAALDRSDVFQNQGLSIESIARLAEVFRAPHLEITASMGHFNGSLNIENIYSFIRGLFRTNDTEAVEKLYIHGTSADDETHMFDLLDDRMYETAQVEPNQFREADYTTRLSFLRTSLRQRSPELVQLFSRRADR